MNKSVKISILVLVHLLILVIDWRVLFPKMKNMNEKKRSGCTICIYNFGVIIGVLSHMFMSSNTSIKHNSNKEQDGGKKLKFL